jgi:protease-4
MFHILRSVFGKPWLIEPNEAQRLMDAFMPMWEGRVNLSNAPNTSSVDVVMKNGVAILPITGPIMKGDAPCGGAVGTATLTAALSDLLANADITGIVLKIDSPGGTVDGTQTFASAIKAAAKKKPVVAYVDGMMASAAYWIGSSASHIMAGTKTDVIGSIGTMVQWADFSKRYEAAGIKVHEAYATESTDKNRMFRDANATGDYTSIIKDFLDPVNHEFLSAVKANREGKLRGKENVLTGKVYMAKDALRHGLIDSIGTIDQAVALVQNFATNKPQTSNFKLKSMTLKEKYPNLATAAQMPEGAEALENGSVEVTAEELSRLEQSLADSAAAAQDLVTVTESNVDLQSQLFSANEQMEQLATAQEQIAQRDATIQQLQNQLAEIGAQTDPPQQTATDADPKVSASAPARKYAHQQYAENLLNSI